jgi:maltooligosyltrehalose trehalohydrolase
VLWQWYRYLLQLRRRLPALAALDASAMQVDTHEAERVVMIHRWADAHEAVLLWHPGDGEVSGAWELPAGQWRRRLDSRDRRWDGPGGGLPRTVTIDGGSRISVGNWGIVLLSRRRDST